MDNSGSHHVLQAAVIDGKAAKAGFGDFVVPRVVAGGPHIENLYREVFIENVFSIPIYQTAAGISRS
jgi:ribosomal protein L14